MKVILTSYNDVVDSVWRACYVCRHSYTPSILSDQPSKEEKAKLIKKVVDRGHTSVLEHAFFTFQIEDVSRVLTHQLVRHRIGFSFSQQSLRHTEGENIYCPKTIKDDPRACIKYGEQLRAVWKIYNNLLDLGIPKEDARYILPMSTLSNITISTNARALFHFFDLRLCSRAQREMRLLAVEILRILKEKFPEVFNLYDYRCRTCLEKCGNSIAKIFQE